MKELKSAHEAELDRRRMEQQQFFERQKELYEQNRLAELQQNVGASVKNEKVVDVDETSGRKRKRGSVRALSCCFLFAFQKSFESSF